METVLKQIITKFNSEFDKQKFLDWFNNSKESWLVEERQQILNAWVDGGKTLSSAKNAEQYYSQTFGKKINLEHIMKEVKCEGCGNFNIQCTCYENSKNNFLNTVK